MAVGTGLWLMPVQYERTARAASIGGNAQYIQFISPLVDFVTNKRGTCWCTKGRQTALGHPGKYKHQRILGDNKRNDSEKH